MLEEKIRKVLAISALAGGLALGCSHGEETVNCYTSDQSKNHCLSYYHGESHGSVCNETTQECHCEKPKGAANDQCECYCSSKPHEPIDKGY